MSVIAQRPARSGRIPEFGLLLLAFTISLTAWLLVTQGTTDAASSPWSGNFILGASIAALGLFAAHLLIRKLAPWADPIIFPVAVALNGVGLAMIHRIDYDLPGHAEVGSQLILTGGGIILMLLTLFFLRDHRRLRQFTYTSLLLGIALLLLPLTPGIGKEIYGARLWISLAGFSFQPAELAKICFVIFFAGYLVVQRDNLALAGKKLFGLQFPQLRHAAPILVAWLAGLAILAFEKDFGTALLFFGLFVAMLYLATERISWIVIGGLLSSIGVWFIIQIMPHIQARITVWLHAFDQQVYDSPYGSYQLVQGWFGLASGGLLGTGWGKGYPTMSFASNSDFIIASLGEELGLVGLIAILCLYLLFIFRAFNIGLHLRDGFGKLLAGGFGFAIALQCFVVVGGVTRVIPLTGLAMPFLALGGSALISNWIIVGILLRMSSDARRPYKPATTPLSQLNTSDLTPLLEKSGKAADGVNVDSAADSAADSPDADSHPTEVVHL